jgi:hypothetical protein
MTVSSNPFGSLASSLDDFELMLATGVAAAGSKSHRKLIRRTSHFMLLNDSQTPLRTVQQTK